MSATRILWGQIACVLTVVLITMWAATQWTAWRLGYQPQLGQAHMVRPVFRVDHARTLQQTPYRDIMAEATHLSKFLLVAEL
jgi:type IV secretory pathway TraG/TraD family ATPase VirD4